MTEDALWTPLALVAPLGARVSGSLPARGVTGISIDTRTLVEGDLFVALKGDNSDGHDYVRKAFEAGAAAAVIDEAHAQALTGAGPLYVAKDTLAALEGLGRARVDHGAEVGIAVHRITEADAPGLLQH